MDNSIYNSLEYSKPTPTVFIIIPTYNRAKLIKRAINSALKQSFENFEIIVVDDASKDDTQKVIEDFDDPRIIYIKQDKNLGSGASRNTGINASRSQYIAFLDSDDEWLPYKLEKQLNVFQAHESSVGVVYGHWKDINAKTLKTNVKRPELRGSIFNDLLYTNVVGSPSGVLIRREYFSSISGFDTEIPSTVDDWDIWIRLACLTKFEFVSEVLTIMWDEQDSVKTTGNHTNVINGYLALLKKHPKMNEIHKNFRVIGNASLEEKSKYIFGWGKRMVFLGSLTSNPEAIKVGQINLFTNVAINPLNGFSWLHWLISLFGGKAYFNFIKLEKRTMKLASHLRRLKSAKANS
jgi:glycosyltransferase involved in cell wall biosynthesis